MYLDVKIANFGYPILKLINLSDHIKDYFLEPVANNSDDSTSNNEEIGIVTTQPINENEEFETTLTPLLRLLNFFNRLGLNFHKSRN